MKKKNRLNELLVEIYNRFNVITIKASNDFVDDYMIYTNVLYDKYEKIDLNFWNYFRKKYDLPELIEYFQTPYELLRTVFDICIHPFYLRLDVLPSYRRKYETLADSFEKYWKFTRFISNNWITIIAVFLMAVFFILAGNTEVGSSDYEIFLSLATGIMISLIIGSINAAHKRRLRKKTSELNKILFEYGKLKSKYESIKESIMTKEISEKSDFVREFCIFNDAIYNFLKNTESITSIQNSSVYHWFNDFEKEILDYSTEIMNKNLNNYTMNQTTDEEIGVLQKYVVQFGCWIGRFESDLESLKRNYVRDIEKMEDKLL